MSGRQIFSEAEKLCLQELIIKYKLNSASTITAGNPGIKKVAWGRLVEEYNSNETNIKRTEAQLKKCWDNLKTRKKALLSQEKKERMRTGGGCFHPKPGPSKEDPMLIDEALLEQTDVEIRCVIDSDNLPTDTSQEIQNLETVSHQNHHLPLETAVLPVPEDSPSLQTYNIVETVLVEPEPEIERDIRGRSGSRHTDYSVGGQQTPGKNLRTKVISEEFKIRKSSYERAQEREEELHKLMLQEKQWLVKAAEELYKKAIIERQSAEELLRCNQAKREAAELALKNIK